MGKAHLPLGVRQADVFRVFGTIFWRYDKQHHCTQCFIFMWFTYYKTWQNKIKCCTVLKLDIYCSWCFKLFTSALITSFSTIFKQATRAACVRVCVRVKQPYLYIKLFAVNSAANFLNDSIIHYILQLNT